MGMKANPLMSKKTALLLARIIRPSMIDPLGFRTSTPVIGTCGVKLIFASPSHLYATSSLNAP
jgi:hypothetical protein